MAKGFLDDAEIDVPCPQCGEETAQTIGWLNSHDQMTCEACCTTFRLDTAGLKAGTKQVNDSVEDLVRDLTKMRFKRR